MVIHLDETNQTLMQIHTQLNEFRAENEEQESQLLMSKPTDN